VYRHILNLLGEYCGSKAEYVLALGLVVLATAVLLLLSRAWRRGVAEAEERGGWRGIVLGLANGLFSLVLGAAIVAALGGSLLVQSGLFNERHGQMTQTNYDTIKTNWGPPHEQNELRVAHYITEEQTFFLFKDGRTISEEELSTGKAKPADKPEGEADDETAGDDKSAGQAPIKIKRKVRKPVPQNSIVSGKVAVDVRMNYRQKGSAFYTCYEDAWTLEYTVKNRSDKATEAEFKFPMPADQGVYDKLEIAVDGKNWMENLVLKDNAQTWKMPMQPGQTTVVRIAYASRGMDYLRYTPATMATREEYKVAMRIYPSVKRGDEPAKGRQQFAWKDMGLPVGSMTPPVIKESSAVGEPLTLEWDMKAAATTLGMGVILPEIKQPGYFGARLLHEAPLGLLLLAASLVVTWMLLGRDSDLFSLAVLVIAYYLFYTFAAYLSDHLTWFPACFMLAALATMLLSALYLWLGWGRTFAAHQTVALVAVFTIYYPLAALMDENTTGLMNQILYWGLALYAALLAVVGNVINFRRSRKAEPRA
jgi:hypothetical protein